MLKLTKIIHVLALGLWFGGTAFFIFIVGLSLFNTFETLGASTERPAWFPLVADFQKNDSAIDGPREQGSRVAGAAVAPILVLFFLFQGVCGFLATATSLGWSRSHPGIKAHSRRTTLLLLALATVLIGWSVEQKVSALRGPRNQTTDTYLKSDAKTAPGALTAMEAARREFVGWHGVSLILSFATLVLVTWAMTLVTRLPEEQPIPPQNESPV